MNNKMTKAEVKKMLTDNKKKDKSKTSKVNVKWIIKITIMAFLISFTLSFISQSTIPKLSVIFGIIITLVFVLIGVVFDIIGVAVTTADEKIFHSMSAKQVRGAKVAVKFKKNADKVASFCNDVIGDICGIVSGVAGTTIATALAAKLNINILIVNIVVAAIIASLTIGGKAIGKGYAISKSNIILYKFAKIISYVYKG